MPILNNIPRKNNRIATGGDRAFDLSRVQHVPNGFDGLSYSSPFTPEAFTNATHHNTATIAQVAALQVEEPGDVVPSQLFTKIHPSTKTVLNNAGKTTPIAKRVGGPSPHSNTPFHPKPEVLNARPVRHPSVTTDKFKTAAAVTTTVPLTSSVGSFLPVNNNTLSAHSNLDKPVSRWNTIKKGAAG
jgi:hypothetical protein